MPTARRLCSFMGGSPWVQGLDPKPYVLTAGVIMKPAIQKV